MTTTVITNPNEFQGYPVDLLRGLAGMGPALIGDDALYEAAKAYNESAAPGGTGALGPALLTADASVVVKSIHAIAAPKSASVPVAVPESTSWDKHELADLLALVQKHGVTVDGRVKTPGKLIAALEAAGVTP